MMKFRVSYDEAFARITEVLQAITGSDEWRGHAQVIAGAEFDEVQEPFRTFFDGYEGGDGVEWLGIMETAVIKRIQSQGADLTAERTTVDRIIDWMESHPNIELLR